ncbi:class I SAM-dependent methyltransferase [Actinokineospora sp. G85]|uniref:class I SAM-dependent methyltransferase n=1 Tax=Actinokineospora sp. G85 TaxID=3406626 RepID=UPI003C709ADA
MALSARQSLYSAQRPRHDPPAIVLDQIPATARTLLDVGCGNGSYLTKIRTRTGLLAIGLDVSAGVMAGMPGPLLVGDAADLPLADDSVDVVLAMHMLYHVEDIDRALSEAARVLRPGGLFVASTNARDDKRELGELWTSAAADALGVEHGPKRLSLSDRFPLDDAPYRLARHFDSVRTHELPGVIIVDRPDPVIAHLASYRAWADDVGVPFDETLDRAHHRLVRELERHGAFRITCRGGILFAVVPS